MRATHACGGVAHACGTCSGGVWTTPLPGGCPGGLRVGLEVHAVLGARLTRTEAVPPGEHLALGQLVQLHRRPRDDAVAVALPPAARPVDAARRDRNLQPGKRAVNLPRAWGVYEPGVRH